LFEPGAHRQQPLSPLWVVRRRYVPQEKLVIRKRYGGRRGDGRPIAGARN